MNAIESTVPQLVSVVIPTFNRAHLITEAIDSVFAQTYQDIELIIIDDGSTDHTEQIIANFKEHRIRYYRISHSGSFSVVRNTGIKHSNGSFIAFLDSDDIWEPTKVEAQVNALQSSNIDFCFTQVFLFGDTTVRVPAYPALEGDLLGLYLEEGHFAYYPSSLMFKRKILDQTGLLNELSKYGSDPEFFVTLCHHAKGRFLEQPLTRIRKHPANTSIRDPLFSYPEMTQLLKTIYQKGYITKRTYTSTISKFYYKIGLIEKDRRLVLSSMKHFSLFLYHRPLQWKGWARMLLTPLHILAGRKSDSTFLDNKSAAAPGTGRK